MKDLPEGFTVDSAPPPEKQGSKLPEGFQEDPKAPSHDAAPEIQSAAPYVIDKFKQGVAGTMALPGLAVDAAQGALDVAMIPGNLANKVKEKFFPSADAEAAKKQWFVGNDPEKENAFGYKQLKKWSEMALRSDRLLTGAEGGDLKKDVEPPKDLFGKVSKTTEYAGKISEFIGAGLIPGAGPVVAAQRKLLTALTEVGGATLSGMSASGIQGTRGELGSQCRPYQGNKVGRLGKCWDRLQGLNSLQIGAQTVAKSLNMGQKGADIAKEAGFGGRSPEAQKAAAEALKNKELREALDINPTSGENLQRLTEVQKKIENFKPGIAQASGAPGVIAMQQKVSQSSPEALAKAAAMDARNQSAIARFKAKVFPPSKQAVNEAARARVAAVEGQNRQDLLNTERELTALGDKYARDVDKKSTGEALRQLYWAKRKEAKGKLDTQIEDVYKTAEAAGVKADMTGVRDTVKKVMGEDKETFQNPPAIYKKIQAEFNPPPPVVKPPVTSRGSTIGIRRQSTTPPESQQPVTEVSFEKLHSLWREATREQADLTAAGKLDEARKVGIVKDQLRKQVDKFNAPELGPVGEKFRAFNQDYAQYSKVFKKGAGDALSRTGRKGEMTDSEDIVDKIFFRAGDKKKGIEDFFHMYGRDEKAAELLHDGIVDNFSRSAVDANGDFNAKGAANWMKKNETALNELPNLREKLQKETDVGGMLVQRKRELKNQQKIFDKSVMKAAAQEQQPEKSLWKPEWKDPRMFKALLASAKTPEAKQSLARSIADMALSHKGDKNAFEFVTENEKTLKPVMDALGKDHWDNLKTLAEADMIANRVVAPKGVSLSGAKDPFENVLGISGKGLLSRGMNVAKGYMSKSYALADAASHVYYKIRTEELARLREEALFDPEIASVLAKVVKQDSPAKKDLLDLKALAFQAGITISSHGISSTEKREKARKEGRLPVDDPEEGRGKWKK